MLEMLNNYVILKVENTQQKTPSGLILDVDNKSPIGKGVVISSASDKVPVDSKVLYNKTIGTEYRYNNEKCWVIDAKDLIAIEK
jgi:co-chaperonin GroES (HSP10)